MLGSRGRSRSVSKAPTSLISMSIQAVNSESQNSQESQKTLFPLLRHLAASQKLNKRERGPEPRKEKSAPTAAQPVLDLESRTNVFKIFRANKSLKSIKIKRKRTYYWKLFELASLYMVRSSGLCGGVSSCLVWVGRDGPLIY